MTESHKRGGRRGSPTPAAALALVAAALTAVGAGAFGPTRPRRSRRPLPPIGPMSVDTGLEQLGRSADGQTIQLPRDPARAGWYANGATPGEAGPTITVGYLAGRHRRGVFGRPAAPKIGAHVDVRLTDGARVTYRVDEIATYPARAFPAAEVYGPTSTSTLRIVTCDGPLRPGQQLGNAVANGHQIFVHH